MRKKSLLYIGNKLSKQGVTVTTIDTLSVLLEQEGFKVYTSSSLKNKVFRFLDMVFSTLKYANKVSVVLIDTYSTQNYIYAVSVAKICRWRKIPYIPILHGGDLPQRLTKSPRSSKRLFDGAKTNVSPSRYLLESFRQHGYKNISHIPNTIEIENYPFLLRKEIKPKLLWVRSFSKIYNPMLAIEIVKKLHQRGTKASLTMVGPDKDGSLERCRDEAKKYNLQVSFSGKLKRSQWISLSKTHDIFINTTNFDNAPVSVIEATALGLPIISTNVGGLPYLIEDQETGILVAPNNADAFADAIKDLINNPRLVESISKNARANAETYNWLKVKNKWVALLSE